MAREIKFRGWHTGQKKMYSCEKMVADQLTLLPSGQFINVSGSHTYESEIYPSDKFIPLQYTGLKDKNGKEIYEGDVVRFRYDKQYILASVQLNEYGLYFTNPSQRWGGLFYANMRQRSTIVVIGNIYENTELLKAVK